METKKHNGIECKFDCNKDEKNLLYKLTFPNNKIYIGQTVQQLKNRIKDHCNEAVNMHDRRNTNPKNRAIRKYREFVVEIIEYCNNVDELNIREDEIINEYRNNGYILYNIACGGLNNCDYFGSRCVITDYQFNIIKEFKKVKHAGEYLGISKIFISNISKFHTHKNMYYVMKSEYYYKYTPGYLQNIRDAQINEAKNKMRLAYEKNKIANKKHYNVVQIDYKYNVIAIIDIHMAMNKYGSPIQGHVCNNAKIRYVYGYYWIKEDEYNMLMNSETPLNAVLNGLNYVLQIDRKGDIIGEYQTIREASKATNKSIQCVAKCINYNTVCSDTYYFEWSDSYDKSKHNTNRVDRTQTGIAKVVYEYDKNLNLINTFQSIRECARAKGVGKNTIKQRLDKRSNKRDTFLSINQLAC
ncbi:MAG: NUMOD1 domain-containing DNA-binding protein [Paludibacteraceae bacterium]